jgi:hypothetical protein
MPIAPGCTRTAPSAVLDRDGAEAAGDVDEDAVRDALAGEAGAAGAEGQGHLQLVAQGEEGAHLVLAGGERNRARDQPVEARGARARDQLGRRVEDARRREDRIEACAQRRSGPP